MSKKKRLSHDANPDPITGEAGAHPVGVGVGSASGATIGAVVGSAAGPVGTTVGAAIGGVAGGLTGKSIAERVNPTVEDAYWLENYPTRPYAQAGATYDTYQPAYRAGWEGSGRYGELNWEKAEPRLREDWQSVETKRPLPWDKALPAVKDAWDRTRRDRD